MESRDGVDVSIIRVFQRCPEKRNPLLYFKVTSESKTEATRPGHRPYGLLEKEEGHCCVNGALCDRCGNRSGVTVRHLSEYTRLYETPTT